MTRVLDYQTDIVVLCEFGSGCDVLRCRYIDAVLDVLPNNTLITFSCEWIATLVEPHWVHDIAGEGKAMKERSTDISSVSIPEVFPRLRTGSLLCPSYLELLYIHPC